MSSQPRLPAATFPTDELHLNANPFQLASARLHASATPEYLAGREEEQEEIRDKVGEAIRKARGELFCESSCAFRSDALLTLLSSYE